jgi:hypothetical protein
MFTALSIGAGALLAVFLLRRRNGRNRGSIQAEMARYRRASEKEHREWIYPFEM